MISDMKQRLYWCAPFKNSDQLYMLDGAIVKYSQILSGISYEHHLIRDNMCIFEKPIKQFYGLPVGETVEFMLNAEDDGLFSFLEIRFTKYGEIFESFSAVNSKMVRLVVPDYDDFKVRVLVRGKGSTRLIDITARVTSLEGFIITGDKQISNQVGVEKIIGSEDELLVTFSDELRYLTADFFTDSKPQVHFVSLDGSYEEKTILDYLNQQSISRLRLFQAPDTIFQSLSNSGRYDTITVMEF